MGSRAGTHTSSLLLLVALGAGGCTGSLTPLDDQGGGGDDTGGGGSAAQTMFTSNVAPLLQAACAGCHTGAAGSTPLRFLGATGLPGFYSAVTTEEAVIGNFDPAAATLVIKGLHDGGNARAWTATEKSTIDAWLAAEATERGL